MLLPVLAQHIGLFNIGRGRKKRVIWMDFVVRGPALILRNWMIGVITLGYDQNSTVNQVG